MGAREAISYMFIRTFSPVSSFLLPGILIATKARRHEKKSLKSKVEGLRSDDGIDGDVGDTRLKPGIVVYGVGEGEVDTGMKS